MCQFSNMTDPDVSDTNWYKAMDLETIKFRE